MMHAAFCLFEAGSVFQTFSPDKPHIFVPWTTVLDKPKSGEVPMAMAPLQKFDLFLHGTECGVSSPQTRNTQSSYMSVGALEHH